MPQARVQWGPQADVLLFCFALSSTVLHFVGASPPMITLSELQLIKRE
jgi:hypothetical protein